MQFTYSMALLGFSGSSYNPTNTKNRNKHLFFVITYNFSYSIQFLSLRAVMWIETKHKIIYNYHILIKICYCYPGWITTFTLNHILPFAQHVTLSYHYGIIVIIIGWYRSMGGGGVTCIQHLPLKKPPTSLAPLKYTSKRINYNIFSHMKYMSVCIQSKNINETVYLSCPYIAFLLTTNF